MKKLTKIAAAASLLLGLGVAGIAQASPYLEIMGGGAETQNFSGTQIIPNGALGYDSLPVGLPASAMGMYLRDTSAPDGTVETLRFDYVGSDADYTNEYTFDAAGGFTWCNKPTGCSGTFTSPANNNSWSGPFGATAYGTGIVGQLIDFRFASITNAFIFANGDAGGADGHLFYASLEGGDLASGFHSISNPRTGTFMAIGLTDGFTVGSGDDDHQDLMVRVSVPEPGTVALLGLGLLAMAGVRRRRS